jgi:hypothetical protein
MALLLKYRTADGGIVATWEASPASLLDAQRGQEDPLHGYVQLETAREGSEVGATSYVAAGALRPKRQVILTAVPNPFPRGVGHGCHITVTPFEPCTVLLDGVPYALTEDDQVLELSSEEPHTFTLTLGAMAQVRAEPLSVEAQ